MNLIDLLLPSLPADELPVELLGVREMKQFWKSADPSDLPENPAIAVVMDWLNRMSPGFGFERELALLGTNHQMVMNEIFIPLENSTLRNSSQIHPLVLLHILWRIGVQFAREGYMDSAQPIAEIRGWGTKYLWASFRKQVISPSPLLTFRSSTA